jgi:hypothetical protein
MISYETPDLFILQSKLYSLLLTREDNVNKFRFKRGTTNLGKEGEYDNINNNNKKLTKKPSISGLEAKVLQLPPLTEPP